MKFTFTAALFKWDARPNWFFVSVPPEMSADIDEIPRPPRGFDSLRVRARIGGSEWVTSIFPGRDAYSLPVKKAVRVAESISEHDEVLVEITLIDL